MTIKVKYLADILPIEIFENGDLIDLRCAEDVWIEPGEYKLIPLGVAIKLPEGYEAHVVPRSSTFVKYGILMANSVGIIDGSYCGPTDQWHFPAFRPSSFVNPVHIPKNERICQFRIVKNQPAIEIETVDELDGPDRGGFGSSDGVF